VTALRHALEGSRRFHFVELLCWAACALLALFVVAGTLGADFPARAVALEGEAVALLAATILAGLSLERALKDEPGPRTSIARALPGITLRVSFGVPAFLFLLVAAASGFSA
jgi:hypothetical protein